MRIGSALLVGTTALALAFTAGSASASTRHHYRHHHYRHHAVRAAAAPVRQDAFADTSLTGNNPYKRYPARHDANAREEATLSLGGNNPTKRYKVRHASNLRMEATLSRSGNNGVKYYPSH
jgi:hypothetical protein